MQALEEGKGARNKVGFTTCGKPKMAQKQYNSPMTMYSEEVLEESEFPMKARRVQNFVSTSQPKTNLLVHHRSSNNNEALVEIEEAEEPSIHLPPKQRLSDKPANM